MRFLSVYVVDTVLLQYVSFVHLLVIYKNIRILAMGRVVTHVFFRFILQEELIASEVILLSCTKLVVKVSYLFAISFS